ncbi:MAG: response regulator transcription factor [Elusimicrobiota bacterium]
MPKKILMIDDDPALLDSVKRFLKLKGYEAEGLRLPDQAADKARSFRPDMILLDIELPGISGWDVCRVLKSDKGLTHVPVVMVSGHRMTPEDKAKGIELGADDYLTKPFDLQVLLLKIDAILRVTEA